MTVCMNYDIEMLRNLKALYKEHTGRFLTIFSSVDASSLTETGEERGNLALSDLPWKDKKGSSSIRPTLKPFEMQHPGKLLRNWVKRMWEFPSARCPSQLN